MKRETLTSESDQSISHSEIAGLLAKHQGAILGYLYACLRNHADAEDVFQEVSMAAVELSDQLREADGFLPWIRQIARFRVLKHVERSKRLSPMNPALIDQLAEAAGSITSSSNLDDRTRAINDCLDRLPTESRRMILMRYAESNPSVSQLASHIDRSVQATYALLKRIRVTLRECVNFKMAEGEM